MRPLPAATGTRTGVGEPAFADDRRKTAARILVVKDEAEIAALIAYQLTREGYLVETARDGATALNALHRDLPDLPVLDRIQGLELGADDYFTKPFSPRELVLRRWTRSSVARTAG